METPDEAATILEDDAAILVATPEQDGATLAAFTASLKSG